MKKGCAPTFDLPSIRTPDRRPIPAKRFRGTWSNCLPLLPSGPDGVRQPPIAQSSDHQHRSHVREPAKWRPRYGSSTLLERIAGYRAPLVPRLAQPFMSGAERDRTADLYVANVPLSQTELLPRFFGIRDSGFGVREWEFGPHHPHLLLLTPSLLTPSPLPFTYSPIFNSKPATRNFSSRWRRGWDSNPR
jgi:hypothetical protein